MVKGGRGRSPRMVIIFSGRPFFPYDLSMMTLPEFCGLHLPAIEQDEVKHCLMIGLLEAARRDGSERLRVWSLGGPGACAIRSPGRAVVLGALSEVQCHALAEDLGDEASYGAVGADLTAKWFVERAEALGFAFGEPMPQHIHALSAPPRYPGAPGRARAVAAQDGPLFADWILAFNEEAVPEDRPPKRERLLARAGDGDHLFWVVDGEPVSLAGVVRRTRRTAAIAAVYTPPALRGRGYGGSVTAAAVEKIFAEGRSTACLYTDLRNPASNRCYAKVGFRPHCESWFFPRRPV